jgi:CHASE2 domain-containing sensor protein
MISWNHSAVIFITIVNSIRYIILDNYKLFRVLNKFKFLILVFIFNLYMNKKTVLLLKDSFLCSIFSLLLIFLLSFLFINISFFNPMKKAIKDFSFLDVYYAKNFNASNTINKDIIIINAEHRSRFELSYLLENVSKAQPKVIGVDIIFKDKKDTSSDSLLLKSLNYSNVVNSYLIDNKTLTTSFSQPLNDDNLGFVNFNFDNKTNVIRDFIGIKKIDTQEYRSFPSEVAELYLNEKWDSDYYNSKISRRNRIKYYGRQDSFMSFGFDEFMLLSDKSIIRDKIVLIGYLGGPMGSEYDVEDKHFTPLNTTVSGKSNPDMFGIVIHANIINMLINKDFMFTVSNFWIIVFSFFTMFFAIMYFLWLQENVGISFKTNKKIVLFLFTVILMWFTLWLFNNGIVFKTAPIIGITLAGCGFINYYKYLIKLIKKKREWKSYI